MNAVEAKRIITTIALDSGKVLITPHATKQMNARGFTRLDALRCIEQGTICEGPYQGPTGDWKVNMQRHAAGEEMVVVVAICDPTLVVITAF